MNAWLLRTLYTGVSKQTNLYKKADVIEGNT